MDCRDGADRLRLDHARVRATESSRHGISGSLGQSRLVELQRRERDGNYTVFHAKLSKPFRDQFPPEKLAAIFKEFRDKRIDFDVIAAKKPISTEEPKIGDNGVLSIKGYFDTTPSRVNYDLSFIMSDGEWRLIKVDVDVKKP